MINDINDRNQYYSIVTPDEELKTFFMHKLLKNKKKLIKRILEMKNINSQERKLPRLNCIKTNFNKSINFEDISETDKIKLLNFFNNPENFSWGETIGV